MIERARRLGFVVALGTTAFLAQACGGIVGNGDDGRLGADGDARTGIAMPDAGAGDTAGIVDGRDDHEIAADDFGTDAREDAGPLSADGDAASVNRDVADDLSVEGQNTICNGAPCRGVCEALIQLDGGLGPLECTCGLSEGGCPAPTVCCGSTSICTGSCAH